MGLQKVCLICRQLSEKDFLRFLLSFPLKMLIMKDLFEHGFISYISAAGDNTKVNQIIFKFGLNYFQTVCCKWNDKFEIQNIIMFVVR